MIDWRSLAFNAVWIFATALALAAFSQAGWEAARRGETLRQGLGKAGFQRAFLLAAMLFCVGQAGLAVEGWRLAAWTLLGMLSLAALLFRGRSQM